jgi:hypothetical protein
LQALLRTQQLATPLASPRSMAGRRLPLPVSARQRPPPPLHSSQAHSLISSTHSCIGAAAPREPQMLLPSSRPHRRQSSRSQAGGPSPLASSAEAPAAQHQATWRHSCRPARPWRRQQPPRREPPLQRLLACSAPAASPASASAAMLAPAQRPGPRQSASRPRPRSRPSPATRGASTSAACRPASLRPPWRISSTA